MIRKPRIFTLGHSNLSLDAFLRLLEGSSIRLVADIRSNPASSRFPHFERNALSSALAERGVSYRWFRELGGRVPEGNIDAENYTALDSPDLKRYAAWLNSEAVSAVVTDLIGLAASTVAVVLCAEREVSRCHRVLLSDKLVFMGLRVTHILDGHTATDHCLHPDVVVDNNKLYYRSRQLKLLN
jgi:uncharacterized protein (DUF488 family)